MDNEYNGTLITILYDIDGVEMKMTGDSCEWIMSMMGYLMMTLHNGVEIMIGERKMGPLMIALYNGVETKMIWDSYEWIMRKMGFLMRALYDGEMMIGTSYEGAMGSLMIVLYDRVEIKMIGN